MSQIISFCCVVFFVVNFLSVDLLANGDIGNSKVNLEERLLELQYEGLRLELERVYNKARKDLKERQVANFIIYKAESTDIKSLPQKCTDAKDKVSGVYELNSYTDGALPLKVYCDFDTQGGGWTVIQRRINGSVSFYRTWQEYKTGFGDASDEYWLGLDHIHNMTKNEPQELLITLEDFDNQTRWAKYDWFVVGNETEQYALNSLGVFSGNVNDSLSYHLHKKFSTYDVDNDSMMEGSCALYFKSGWWFHSCLSSNLNGLGIRGPFGKPHCCRGILWSGFRGEFYSLKNSKMMIRPKSFVVSE